MNSAAPKISVGMPIYNGDRYLRFALNSLLQQDFPDFEIIISDNGSTDSTEHICREYADKHDRIRYFRHDRNRGAAWNYNFVFGEARGEYFKWATHDDECLPTFLSQCLDGFDRAQQKVVLVYPRTLMIDLHGYVTARFHDNMHLSSVSAAQRTYHLMRAIRRCNPVFGLIRRDALECTGLIRPFGGSDKVLLLELALQGQFREVQEYLFLRRLHSESSTVVHTTERELDHWFDTGRSRWQPSMPTVQRLLAYLLATMRARHLPVKERIACARAVLRGRLGQRYGKTQFTLEQRAAWVNQAGLTEKMLAAGKLFAQGKLAEARAICREVHHYDPDHPYAWHLIGIVAMQKDDFTAAEDAIGRALQRRPDKPEFRNSLAVLRRRQGQLEEAESIYRELLDDHPDYAEGRHNFGALLAAARDHKGAVQCFERAVAIKPDYVAAWQNLAISLRAIGDFERADAVADTVSRLQGKNQATSD